MGQSEHTSQTATCFGGEYQSAGVASRLMSLTEYRRNPNHILLDYYDSNGNAPFNVAASLNGVPAPTNSIEPESPGSTATATGGLTGASGAGSGTSSGSGSGAVVETSRLNHGPRVMAEMSTGMVLAVSSVVGGLALGVLGVIA